MGLVVWWPFGPVGRFVCRVWSGGWRMWSGGWRGWFCGVGAVRGSGERPCGVLGVQAEGGEACEVVGCGEEAEVGVDFSLLALGLLGLRAIGV